jgi:hypothetical protein
MHALKPSHCSNGGARFPRIEEGCAAIRPAVFLGSMADIIIEALQ